MLMLDKPTKWLCAALLVLAAALPASSKETADPGILYPILVEDKWGFISESGEVVAHPTYDSIKGPLFIIPGCMELKFAPDVLGSDGPIAVGQRLGAGVLAWGFVGPQGEIVPPMYNKVYGFHDGIAAVSRDGKWGVIDATGAEVIPFEYDYVSGFREGASAVMVDGWWGLIDREGQYVVASMYDIIRPLTYGPYFMFEKNGLQGVMHANGEILADARFDLIHALSEGLLNVTVGDKYGYFNIVTMEFEIEPQFDVAWPFSEGIAWVKIGDATGFINRTGNFTVELRTPDKSLFSNFDKYHYFDWPKLSPIRKYIEMKRGRRKFGLIDSRDGTVLIEPSFDSIGMVYDGRAVFKDGGEYGYLDVDGKIAIPAQYDLASDFSSGLAYWGHV